jgi:hypothetical protein
MKYLVLIQHFDPDSWERFSEDERGAIAAEFKALAESPESPPACSSRQCRRRQYACKMASR